MSMFDSMKINASGLSLERLKLDVTSSNIANVNTVRTEEGGPYLKKQVLFEESLLREKSGIHQGLELNSFGVKATGIAEDPLNTKLMYEPSHPDANEEGYVEYPNVDMADEMIEMMTTLRTYDANATALNASKEMLKKALEISR